MGKRIALLLIPLALTAVAQETAPIRLQLDTRQYTERILQPVMPRPVDFGSLGTKPKPDFTLPSNPFEPDRQARNALNELPLPEQHFGTASRHYLSAPEYNFRMNPYSRNRDVAGVIAVAGGGFITGASSYEAMPALGNFAEASVAYTRPIGEHVLITGGVSGNKYHIGRDAWNSYGVFGQATWRLSDRISLNAFGQHYWNQMATTPAALPYQQGSLYGATMGFKMSETVSLDVGAQRYYDPYTRQWKTLPIVAPTVNIMGAPIRLDVGGLLYQILDNLLGSKRYDSGGSGVAPSGTFNGPLPAGFNPNSPVRIPDALRR